MPRFGGVRLLLGLLLGGCVGACSLVTSVDGLSGGEAGDAGAGSAFDNGPDGAPSNPNKDPSSTDASADSPTGSHDEAGNATGGGGEDSATTPDAISAEADGASNTPDSAMAPDTSTVPPHDSGADTSTGPTPPFCASLSPAPLFCDDFDEGVLAAAWDQVSSGEGSAALDSTYVVSAPNAMRSSVNAGETAAGVDVAGYKSFTGEQGGAGVYTLSFDMRVDSADESSAADAVLAAIQLWNGSAVWDLELELTSYASGAFSVSMSEDGAGYVSHSASQTIALHAWTSVALEITLPAGSGGATPATLSFNGTEVASATVHVSTSNPIPEIIIGPTFASSSSSGWTVRYDNVTFN